LLLNDPSGIFIENKKWSENAMWLDSESSEPSRVEKGQIKFVYNNV
jgi:hypothetical protein